MFTRRSGKLPIPRLRRQNKMHGQPQGDEPEETLPLGRQLVPLDVGPEVINHTSVEKAWPVKNAAIDAHRHPAPDGKVVKSSSTKTSCVVVRAWGIAPIREAIAIHAYHSVS